MHQVVRLGLTWLVALGCVCLGYAPALAQTAPPAGGLRLRVLDEVTRQPVANARVLLVGPKASSNVTTDLRGEALFQGLAAGPHHVGQVGADGYMFRPGVPQQVFQITESKPANTGELTLTPLGAIVGRVLDDEGDPIRGAQVISLADTILLNQKHTLDRTGSATTDEQGRYRIAELEPRKYFVHAIVPSGKREVTADQASEAGFAPAYYPNAETASQGSRVTVSPGADTPPVDFRLRRVPLFRIGGTVTGLPPEVTFAEVSVRSCVLGLTDPETLLARVKLDPPADPNNPGERRFEVSGIPPGTYCVTMEVFARVKFEIALLWEAVQSVTVADRDETDLRLMAAPSGRIEGRFVLPDDATFEFPYDVTLTPLQTKRGIRELVNREDGSFVVQHLPRGELLFGQSRALPGDAYYVKSVRAGNRDVAGKLNLADGIGELVVELAPVRGEIRGTVRSRSRGPTGPILVLLVPDGPLAARLDLVKKTISSDQGEFTFQRVPPGSWRVLPFEEEMNMPALPDFLERFSATSVRLPDGGQVRIEADLITAQEIAAALAQF